MHAHFFDHLCGELIGKRVKPTVRTVLSKQPNNVQTKNALIVRQKKPPTGEKVHLTINHDVMDVGCFNVNLQSMIQNRIHR